MLWEFWYILQANNCTWRVGQSSGSEHCHQIIHEPTLSSLFSDFQHYIRKNIQGGRLNISLYPTAERKVLFEMSKFSSNNGIRGLDLLKAPIMN